MTRFDRYAFVSFVCSMLFLTVACSKFSARDMFTDENTNMGSGDTSPDNPENDQPGAEDCGAVTLIWDKNTEANLAGYRVYYGLSPSTIASNQIQISDSFQNSVRVPGLTKNLTYYFAVTAYNNSNKESGYSNVVSGKIVNCALKLQ